ncbi:MAG: hypothetical protein LIO87_08770 [Eubacterium sp.]|nr:hypothetical protein [Eubacterium sp.]
MTELEKDMVDAFKKTVPQVTDFIKEEELLKYSKIELQALSYYTKDVTDYYQNEENIINHWQYVLH